jgi:Mg-chelatase subunit ChlD
MDNDPAADQHDLKMNVIPSAPAKDVNNWLISIKPPDRTSRYPADICCVIDVSGSMQKEAQIQGAGGHLESNGLDMLAIAKHAMRTIVNALDACDRFALVSFNQASKLELSLTEMSKAGKEAAEDVIKNLQADGQTNIWLGLENGLGALQQVPGAGRFRHVMLLSDGESEFVESIMPNLKNFQNQHGQLPGTISTFGFGYEIDSQLLQDIASEGRGGYGFIPDAGFVGTVFVNAVSNLLATMAQDAELVIEGCEGRPVVEKLGTFQFGQSRDIVKELQFPDSDRFKVTLRYKSNDGQNRTLEVKEISPASQADVEPHVLRYKFIEAVKKANAQFVSNPEVARNAIAGLISEISKSIVASDPRVDALREDASGQISEALSQRVYYDKWGKHYLPSIVSAHTLQQCNNFKDPSVQLYGGQLFQNIRDEADEIFVRLPPASRTEMDPSLVAALEAMGVPQAEIRSMAAPAPAAPVDMSAYHDRYGG